MSYLILLLVLAALILFLWLSWRKLGRGPALFALSGLVITLLLGSWSILQSRSSTAALGFIFLPIYAVISALAGLFFGIGREKRSLLRMGIGGVLFLAIAAQFVIGAFQSRAVNAKRDAEHQAQLARQKNFAKELEKLFLDHPGRESIVLEQFFRKNSADRAAALEVLKTTHASADLLTELSRSEDFGILLSVIRNKNVTPELLESIYERASYKDYFHSDLARNPKTPARVLLQIAKSSTVMVHDPLIDHSNSNCEVLKALEESLSSDYLSDDQKIQFGKRIKDKKRMLCDAGQN